MSDREDDIAAPEPDTEDVPESDDTETAAPATAESLYENALDADEPAPDGAYDAESGPAAVFHAFGPEDDAYGEEAPSLEPEAAESDDDFEMLEPVPKVDPLYKPLPREPIADDSTAGEWTETSHDVLGRKKPTRFRRMLFRAVGACLLMLGLAGLVFAYVYIRANRTEIGEGLTIEHWPVVSDGLHNSNTDLIYWRGSYYLIHASSPWHFGSSECKLVLHRSKDAKAWETVAEFRAPGGNDIRDPKFAAIGARLYVYVLVNDSFMATPESTSMTYTVDGAQWSDLRELEPKGWLLWRPKTRDGLTWYCPAYWHEHGKSALMVTTDGEHWGQQSIIHEGDANDETDFEFLPDGRILATARLEIEPDTVFGNARACTLLATARPPYTQWQTERSYTARLDGPYLFSYKGEVYAVGRRNPDPNVWPTNTASVFGRKRTAIYRVEPDKLTWLTDLPSAGDTSYAGVVTMGDTLFVSYYTSDITRDWPWIIGMLSPSEIRMAQVDLRELAQAGRLKTEVRSR